MKQGTITCSFCSSEFTCPMGMTEAICPKCGRAMPLFGQRISVGDAELFAQGAQGSPAKQDDAWDEPEPEEPPKPGGEAIARIALNQVPASKAKDLAARGQKFLNSLVRTDQNGELIPDLIGWAQGGEPDGNGAHRKGKSLLDRGFDLGPEPVPSQPSPASDAAPQSPGNELKPSPLARLQDVGAAPLPPLESKAPAADGAAARWARTPPANILAELDHELEEEEIPEAGPMVLPGGKDRGPLPFPAMPEDGPGPNLGDGGIQVTIPSEPVQERLRPSAVAKPVKRAALPQSAPQAEGQQVQTSTDQAPAAEGLSPLLRILIITCAALAVLAFIALLWALIQ